MGSSNTHFFRGHLSQTPGFRSAKQIFIANFRYTTLAYILSDHNIFFTLEGGRTMAGSNASGAFLVSLLFLGGGRAVTRVTPTHVSS